MIELRSARWAVLDVVHGLPGHKVVLGDALGCVTVEDLHASEDVPRFANSAMDGYAVRAADAAEVPVRLRVVAGVRAGQEAAGLSVSPGTAVRLMTGAPLPRGADAVVPVENADSEGDSVMIRAAPPPGAFVRTAGSDVVAGQALFPAGTELSPRVLCAMAACGLDVVPVVPRLRVGVLSTGDELAAATAGDQMATVRDANRPALLALVSEAGFEPVDLGAVHDDLRAITQAMEASADRCDALVSSGGVSVGDADYVKLAHRALGGSTARWMQVAIKPAKPFSFALLQPHGQPAFGLAGNPVSAQVAFELFVRPALRKMAGRAPFDAPVVPARAAAPLRREPDGKLHLLRVRIRASPGGELQVEAADGQGSHMALSMARADGLALVPDGAGVPRGGTVDVLPLDQVHGTVLWAGARSLDDALARLGQK